MRRLAALLVLIVVLPAPPASATSVSVCLYSDSDGMVHPEVRQDDQCGPAVQIDAGREGVRACAVKTCVFVKYHVPDAPGVPLLP